MIFAALFFESLLICLILLLPSLVTYNQFEKYKTSEFHLYSNMFSDWILSFIVWMLLIFLSIQVFGEINNHRLERNKINNLIFLDMGCILAYDNPKHVQDSINNFNKIVDTCPQVSIVITSGWRVGKSIKQIQDLIAELGIKGKVIGMTPVLGPKRQQSDEITAWLEANSSRWNSIIILNTHEIIKFKDIQVLTGPEFGGLRGIHTYFAIDKLNRGLPKNFNVGEIETICESNIKKEMNFGGQILQQKP